MCPGSKGKGHKESWAQSGLALAVNGCWNGIDYACEKRSKRNLYVGVARISWHATFRRSQAKVQTGCAVDFSFSFRLLRLLYLLSWCGIYSFLDFLAGRVFEADLLLVPTRLLAAHRRVVQHCHRLVIAATWQMQLDLEPCPTDFLAVASI